MRAHGLHMWVACPCWPTVYSSIDSCLDQLASIPRICVFWKILRSVLTRLCSSLIFRPRFSGSVVVTARGGGGTSAWHVSYFGSLHSRKVSAGLTLAWSLAISASVRLLWASERDVLLPVWNGPLESYRGWETVERWFACRHGDMENSRGL